MVKRYPAQIGSWAVNEAPYNLPDLLKVVKSAVKVALNQSQRPGILLSGGLDSTVLVLLAKEFSPNVPCFTIGSTFEHPDVKASVRLAKEIGQKLFVYLPSRKDKELACEQINTNLPGDENVFLALQLASHFVTDILATDGIDELMGGYWEHARSYLPTDWFKSFWDRLENDHLTPMFESAKQVGVNIHWVNLDPDVVNYISRIPLRLRVHGGVTKQVWRALAHFIGVPDWVIQRKKLGFVNALDT